MRTTIDLPDNLFRRLKVHSASQGTTLKKYITRILENELRLIEKNNNKPLEFPIVPSKYPGKIQLTSEKVASILEKEDSYVSS